MQTIRFLAIAFGPGLLALSVVGALVIVPLLAFSRTPPGADDWTIAATIGEALVVILVPLGIAIGVSFTAPASRSWFVQGLLIFAGWQVIALGCSWVIASGLAGVSMAAVDGATAGVDLTLQKGQFALVLVGFLQLFIVPWTLAAVWFLRHTRLSQEKSVQRASSRDSMVN